MTSRPSQSPTRRRIARTRVAIAVLIFTVGVLIAFGPALHAPFDFDDFPAIVHNATIRSFSPLWAPFRTPPLGTPASGRPAANVSFALSYALNEAAGIDQAAISADRTSTVDTRDAAFGFRLANLLLHALTALVIFAVIRLTLQIGRVPTEFRERASSIAFITTFVWTIHPLQTEAVDYISQRTEILMSLCYITTLFAATRHWQLSGDTNRGSLEPNRRHAQRWFGLAVASSIVGMASKEVMLTAPIVIALHDRAFLSDSWRTIWTTRSRRAVYLALVATTLVAVGLIISGGRAATVGFDAGITPLDYLITQGWAIPHYLHLALWPDALTYDYGQTPVIGPMSIVGLTALGLLAAPMLWCWTRPRLHWLGFLGAMFFVVLAPSSSVVPIRTEIAAERRVYLALIVVILVVAVAVTRVVRARGAQIVLASAVTIALLTVSVRRSLTYRDPATLWSDALAKFPSNGRAYDNVGAAMLRESPPRYRAADSMLVLAIAHDSTLLQPWLRRAAIAAKEARFKDAEGLLLHVLSVAPDDSDATAKLGRVYLAGIQPQRAIPLLLRMAERTTDPDALTNLGNAYILSGQLDSAVAPLRRAVEINPRDTAAYNWLGVALVESGRGREAVAPLERSVAIDPNSGFALGLLSIAYAESDNADAAIRAAASAVDHGRTEPGVLILAGRGLDAVHRSDLAQRCYREAVSLEPSNAEALTRLAMTEAAGGNRAAATRLLRRALQAVPNYQAALRVLAGMK